MKKSLLTLLLIVVAVPAALAAGPNILPFSELRPGMKGTGRTVFRGTQVESFDVEILGTLPNIGPGQNLILARCTGGPLAETGVLAGMSGSPIFVDGKLVGAVAYNWGFAKDAIAGVTPIEEMLAVAVTGAPAARRVGTGIGTYEIERLRSPESVVAFFSSGLPALAAPSAAAMPASIPLSVAGFGPEGLSRILPGLERFGLLPVVGGGSGLAPSPSPQLEAGSAVGLKLVRGDVDMTATGTVTQVDADRVLAFGHLLFGLGPVSFPLTGARVEALMPSLQRSLRLATPLSELGSFVEDRAPAVVGKLGSSARMIPVRLQLSKGGHEHRSYSFDVADDPLLAPLLLYTSLNGILASTERVYGNITLRLEEGSVIKMEGHEDVELQNLFTGTMAPYFATGTSAFILYLLMNNDLSSPRIAGVNLMLEYDDEPRTARLRRVTLDRYRVRAGETVQATVVLRPYRGPDLVLTREIAIPPETPAGPLALNVGDTLAISRTEGNDPTLLPLELSQLIWLINHVPRNDRVYIVASREDSGVFVGGARLPNLPPTVSSILARPRSRGNFAFMPQRSILEEEISVDFAVEGLARVQLEVELP